MGGLKWQDADEIGYRLHRTMPEQDPLKVRFTDLRQYVVSLEGFADDPSASNEALLEAIQMAWLEYHRGG